MLIISLWTGKRQEDLSAAGPVPGASAPAWWSPDSITSRAVHRIGLVSPPIATLSAG